MSRHYLNTEDEADPYMLPSVETFYFDAKLEDPWIPKGCDEPMETGWYWWTCLPGCMPDSDPFGPFDTEEAALADAREGNES